MPIPTYYGDEICHVDGIPYAKDVTLTTFQMVAHGVGCVQPADASSLWTTTGTRTAITTSSSVTRAATSSRSTPYPPGSRVLDIGAGPGRMAQELVAKGCEVTVVDDFPGPGRARPDVEVIQQNLDEPPVFDARKYDQLLMLDVIEHLKDPEGFLEQLVDQFDYGSRTLVLTTPNVGFATQRLMLLFGQFNYGNAGILDRTHTRLFTFRSLKRLLVDSGFRLREMRGVPAPWPTVLGEGALGLAAVRVNELLIRLSWTPFSYQIFVVAHCTPNVRFVLEDSRSRSEAPREVRADTRLTTFLVALGAVAVGAAVQIADGYGRPAAFVWLTVAVAAVLLAVAPPTHRTVEAVLGRALPPILVVALAAQLWAMLQRTPARPFDTVPSWRPTFLLAAVVVVGAGIAIAVGRGVVRHLAILALLATHLALGIWTIRILPQPWPMIDVYMFQRDWVAALLAGVDPYAITFPNPYTTGAYYGPGMVVDGRLTFGSSTRR